jgi:hypothetical protein
MFKHQKLIINERKNNQYLKTLIIKNRRVLSIATQKGVV